MKWNLGKAARLPLDFEDHAAVRSCREYRKRVLNTQAPRTRFTGQSESCTRIANKIAAPKTLINLADHMPPPLLMQPRS